MVPDPSLTPELIQARTFTLGFRGYDQSEVRDFLTRIAAEVRALRERAEQLESAWRSAEERAARPPVLDEETLMAAVGEETAAILRTARAAAQELRNKAADESEHAVAEAREEADRIRADAETLLAEERKAADEAAAGVLDAARTEASELLARANAEIEAIKAKAEQERALTIEGANATRERILEDLGRRRRVASVQIEQLRAGRERLLEAYAVVRRTLEEAQEDLTKADAEARAAADEVGRRMQHDMQHEQPEHESHEVETVGASPAPQPDVPDVAAPDVPDVPDVVEREAAGEPQAGAEEGMPEVQAAQAVEAAEGMNGSEGREAPAQEPASARPEIASRTSPVEELFARIRAGKDEPSAVALDRVLSTSTGEEPDAGADSAQRTEDSPDAAEVGVAETSERQADVVAAETSPDNWLERRESRLIDLESGLTRKLKRALQDEQNDLLDRLRGLRGEPSPEALLPDLDSHNARYARTSVPVLEEAASAGTAFADEVLGSRTTTAQPPDVSDLATDAASVIVGPLRRRLEHLITAGAGEDQSVLVESLGAAYREWKSHRIERVAGDALAAAFSRGTWSATPDGTAFRWIVEDADGPCPDCDDDALAGELPKGEPFPTGQPYPPAHSGCRCLLVPVNN